MTLLDAQSKGTTRAGAPEILWLSDPRARDPRFVGAKAANLAVASSHDHPVLPGFVLTTTGVDAWTEPTVQERARAAWRELSADGTEPLVVRSSSTAEDTESSSQAGKFTSVLDVRGWPAFVDAVRDVVSSADAAGVDEPLAVLVQPWLDAAMGGVAFGRDPVTGSSDIVVSTVRGGPHTLVSGDEQGTTVRLSRRGRVRASDGGERALALPRSLRRRLARLLADLGDAFGSPQDVEWAVDRSQRLWLLQSRPITTSGGAPTGPVLGPGPIAETFPEQLAPLEEDLWLDPLREGLVEALVLSGTRRRSQIDRSPVLVSVGGRPAVDLDLIGASPRRRRWWQALDPRPGARRLHASWRVGRLRAALPRLAEDVIYDVDEALLDVPPLESMSDDALVQVLRNAQPILRSLHGHEILMGMLLPSTDAPSVAAVALSEVQRGRARGLSSAEIIEQKPVTLSLVPPRIGPIPELPELTAQPIEIVDAPVDEADHAVLLREALRLRVRWVHELTARATWELAGRLDDTGRLRGRNCVRHLRFEELQRVVDGDTAPAALNDRLIEETPPLPAAFRRREDGGIVSVGSDTVAIGAGGGRAEGIVYRGDRPPPGSVLVVDNLSPRLTSMLPNLRGLIAETGSPLSHVAILARELGIATVVAYPDARTAFQPGDRVVVDGTTGDVTVLAHASHPTSEPGEVTAP